MGKGKGKQKGIPRKQRANLQTQHPTAFSQEKSSLTSFLVSLSRPFYDSGVFAKPWRNLISKPNFIDTHLHRSSSLKPTFSPILIHTLHVKYTDHVLSLVDSPESSVTALDNPFPFFYDNMVVVGSCSGIVCLCKPPWGDVITLWNPAMRKFRTVQLPKKKPLLEVHAGVSIGLAYDSQENDFIILSLFCFRAESRVPVEVEMCSMKSFCWKQVKNEVGFRVIRPCCNVIIKGVPYWTALLEDKYGLRDVLVYFNVDKKVFDKLPMPGITVGTQWQLVNLEDTVGMLIWAKTDKHNIDVWVMHDEDGWSKKCTVGLVFGFDRLIGCLRNGDILAEDENGVLLLFDMVTSSVKAKLCIDNAKRGSSVIFNYSESLVLIREMLPVEKETARDKQHRENLLKAGINLKIISTDDPQQANWVNRIV